jgi:hypothetical protein
MLNLKLFRRNYIFYKANLRYYTTNQCGVESITNFIHKLPEKDKSIKVIIYTSEYINKEQLANDIRKKIKEKLEIPNLENKVKQKIQGNINIQELQKAHEDKDNFMLMGSCKDYDEDYHKTYAKIEDEIGNQDNFVESLHDPDKNQLDNYKIEGKLNPINTWIINCTCLIDNCKLSRLNSVIYTKDILWINFMEKCEKLLLEVEQGQKQIPLKKELLIRKSLLRKSQKLELKQLKLYLSKTEKSKDNSANFVDMKKDKEEEPQVENLENEESEPIIIDSMNIKLFLKREIGKLTDNIEELKLKEKKLRDSEKENKSLILKDNLEGIELKLEILEKEKLLDYLNKFPYTKSKLKHYLSHKKSIVLCSKFSQFKYYDFNINYQFNKDIIKKCFSPDNLKLNNQFNIVMGYINQYTLGPKSPKTFERIITRKGETTPTITVLLGIDNDETYSKLRWENTPKPKDSKSKSKQLPKFENKSINLKELKNMFHSQQPIIEIEEEVGTVKKDWIFDIPKIEISKDRELVLKKTDLEITNIIKALRDPYRDIFKINTKKHDT